MLRLAADRVRSGSARTVAIASEVIAMIVRVGITSASRFLVDDNAP